MLFRSAGQGQLSEDVEIGEGQARLALKIRLEPADQRGVRLHQRSPGAEAPPRRELGCHEPLDQTGGVLLRTYLHAQQPCRKVFAVARIAATQPAPWLLALLLGVILSILWFFAVSRFLRADAWGEEPPRTG